MRVLYTHRTQAVGAEGAHIKGIYEAFRELGHEISMDCLPGCNPSERAEAEKRSAPSPAGPAAPKPAPSLVKRLYWLIAEHAPQILFELMELLYNALLLWRLGLRCLRARPALVYERYSLNTFAPALICRLLGIRHVLEVNDSVVIERSRPLVLKGLSSLIEGWCLRRADLSVTITEDFRARLLSRFRLAPHKVMVLTNAVSRSRFDRRFDRAGTRARLGLDGGTVLGGTGQFLDWHGLQELVEEMGPQARELDLHFLFVGDGPARAPVTAKAEALEVADRVHFTGMLPIDAVPDYLSALDIAVIPRAAPHASPMKLIEYMAMGLPIVAPDMPSIRAALVDGSKGGIFPAADMRAMGASIRAFLKDPAAARETGRRAREHVLSDLTWDRHVLKVLAALGL